MRSCGLPTGDATACISDQTGDRWLRRQQKTGTLSDRLRAEKKRVWAEQWKGKISLRESDTAKLETARIQYPEMKKWEIMSHQLGPVRKHINCFLSILTLTFASDPMIYLIVSQLPLRLPLFVLYDVRRWQGCLAVETYCSKFRLCCGWGRSIVNFIPGINFSVQWLVWGLNSRLSTQRCAFALRTASIPNEYTVGIRGEKLIAIGM